MRGRRSAGVLRLLMLALGPVLLLVVAGCGGPAAGQLELRIYGEDLIETGIPATTFSDGWSVRFDSFRVGLADLAVSAGHAAPAVLSSPSPRVFELAQPTAGAGQVVASGTVAGGEYDHVTYRIAPVSGGPSLRVAGRAEKPGSPSVTFAWELTSSVLHDCHTAISVDGGATAAELTIHGDHLFYDDLFSPEPLVAFELIATSDADGDGVVTQAELLARDLATQDRYQVGSTGIRTLWDFIAYQATTVGHIDGEGHCDITVE